MEITRRTDYAIRLIATLIDSDGTPLSVREVAHQQEVPYAFARNIQHDLVLSGFIRSVRGAHGGMVLARDVNEITLLELIEAVQGPISVAVCTNSPDWCSRSSQCQFHAVWDGANAILRDYLSSITIRELLDGGQAHLTSISAKYALGKQATS